MNFSGCVMCDFNATVESNTQDAASKCSDCIHSSKTTTHNNPTSVRVKNTKVCSKTSSKKFATYLQQMSHFSYHIRVLSPNLYFMKSKIAPEADVKCERRLAVHYTFLTAKAGHIRRYVSLLSVLGIDVLVVTVRQLQIIKGRSGVEAVSEDICKFLEHNLRYFDKVLFFGCSIGAYVFSETVMKLREKGSLFDSLHSKVAGQIWECCATVSRTAEGVSKTVTRNARGQKVVYSLVNFILSLNHVGVIKDYQAGEEVIRSCPLLHPALAIYSTSDPISPPAVYEEIYELWSAKGVEGRHMVFDNTPHVQNFVRHPEEYKAGVYSFLKDIQLVSEEEVANIGNRVHKLITDMKNID